MVEGVLEPSVTVHVQRDPEDYREAYTWLRWHSWTWPGIIAGFLVVSTTLRFTTRANVFPYMVLWVTIMAFGYFVSLHRIASKMQKTHARNGATSYTFDARGFQYRSDVTHSETYWDAVDRVVETRRSFLLVYANTCFLIIPKRCVASDDLATLREILGKKVR